jgi:hypothetical protein
VLGERRIDVRLRCSGPHAPRPRRELARALEREVAALAGLPLEHPENTFLGLSAPVRAISQPRLGTARIEPDD